MDKTKVTYEAMLGLVAELVLDEAVRNFQRDQLNHAIDEALAAGDEDIFYRLTQQLNELES
ncbi:IDEAL domain-containing protein [Paenibacillus sp. HB172176]|uniref:IDEAL domain-containing protein n=1 Tax=Paenibacillus sp. HB172176 TaxID=2493690 RepID=UPI00143C3BEA|nr:IDEAL domain-containing protein [Paenibacillus sp. HB172176]